MWVLSSFCVARLGGWLRMQFGDGPENWLAHVEPEAVAGHAYYVYRVPDDGTWPGKRPAEAPLSGMFANP
ncbi:hypothetical protein D3C83_211850 [compost metagenome]